MGFGDSTRVNTNVQSLQAYKALQSTNSKLGDHQLRLATGSRLNKAEDDSAGYSIAKKLESKVRGQAQALSNIGDAKSMLTVAEGSLGTAMNILQTMKEKSVQAANDTMGEAEREAIQNQLVALRAELDDTLGGAEFNGIKLFEGDADDATEPLSLQFQVGAGSTDGFGVELDTLNATTLSLTGTALEEAEANVSAGTFGGTISAGTFTGETSADYSFRVAVDDAGVAGSTTASATSGVLNASVSAAAFTGTADADYSFQVVQDSAGADTATAAAGSGSLNASVSAAAFNGAADADYSFQVVQDQAAGSAAAAVAAGAGDADVSVSGATFAGTSDAAYSFRVVDDGSGTASVLEYSTNGGTDWQAAETGSALGTTGGATGSVISIVAGDMSFDLADDYAITNGDTFDIAGTAATSATSKIQYSTDAGSTWTDAETGDALGTTGAATGSAINVVAGEMSFTIADDYSINNGDTFDIAGAAGTPTSKIQYSTDAGSTWTDAETGDALGATGAATGSAINVVAGEMSFTIADDYSINNGDSFAIAATATTGSTSKLQYSTNGGTSWADAETGSALGATGAATGAAINVEAGDVSFTIATNYTVANGQEFEIEGLAVGEEVGGLDVATRAGATSAITTIDAAISTIAERMGNIGDSQSRLSFKQENLQTSMNNYESARSRIADADFAKEQMEIVKLQILQQTGTASLAQANSAPQSVLSLF